MLTRCPACATRFRIYPEHLYAASGQVRCGNCSQVFDAQYQPMELPSSGLAHFPAFTHAKLYQSEAMFWKLGVPILFLTLLIQWLWWERFWLIKAPYTEPAITLMCQYLPCAIPPFRNLETIEILERSLDTNTSGVAIFRFRMVNRALQPQLYPVLELTLLNAETQIIGARRFTPEQYLEKKLESFMLPSELPIQIELKMVNPQNAAAGFQVEFW